MKKIYTFLNSRALPVLLISSLLFTNAAMAQATCGPVVENFNNTGGSTAGFSGSFAFGSNGANGFLIKDRVDQSPVTYTIKSPTYVLPAIANSVGYGFDLGGTENVEEVTVSLVYVSTVTNQTTTFKIDAVYPASTGMSSFCGLVNFQNGTIVPGFSGGQAYQLLFTLRSRTGTGTLGQTITFDNFRTNGTQSLAPLPVTFVSLEATKVNSGVQLTWIVADEENVARYDVERSNDGRSFATIGQVAKAGRDTYVYTDANPSSTSYYRIRNVDNDGKFSYSTIVRIVNGMSDVILRAFPQPVQSQLTIQHPSISGKAMVSVSTADGRIVKSITPARGSMQTNVDMSTLTSGIYMIRLDTGDGKVQTMKVVKQ